MTTATTFPKQLAAAYDGYQKVRSERKVLANCEAVLINFEELPEYMKDNEFIRNYYRCEWPLKDVALSLFSLHNETFNIWTNVMEVFFGRGSDGWLSMMITDSYVSGSLSLHSNDHAGSLPIWPWLIFLSGAMSCLIFSSVSHLFGCHSRRFHYFFWRLDYTGISIMIVCSFFTPIFYIFSDHPYWRFFYLSSVTLLGTAVVVTLLTPSLSTGRSRAFRTTLFLCMGFSGVVPATHAVILHWDQPQILLSLVYEVLMGLLYGVGAIIYVTRIPERWKPGAFDIVGHSHQIFHIFVVAAALAHCAASLMIMDWRCSLPA
ncbi:heptahelical transmembrane protein 2 isoform X2 [Salvia miltiorrhiza]|uniref:heptahelical transmembrane protein 2 isoform X2 n=1 Tax=Salvia miltiorrhiza TaxID=226208 RepID=UPI0025AB79B8|nr:heptahelical transmembrane protein 2 isoform X2 [Salvia miltiorrhiza]